MGGSPHSWPVFLSSMFGQGGEPRCPPPTLARPARRNVTRRDFLKRAGATGAGMTALAVGAGGGRLAQAAARLSRLDPGQPQAAEAGRGAHARLGLGSAGDRSAADAIGRALPVRRAHPATASSATRSPTRPPAPPTSRLKGDLAESWQGEPRPARVDVQAAPGRQVAQRAAAQRARARRRRRQVLLRGLREGRRAVVHVPGDRGHGDARQAHGARPPQDAQRALPAERRRADRRDLLARGAGGGRRSQEAHDRHRALHPQGAHPQGPGGAPAQPRLLRQGPARTSTSTSSSRRRTRRPALAAFRTGQSDIIWLASPSEVETVRKTNPNAVVQALPQLADAVRAGAGPGQAAVQRRAGAPRDLDGHRPPEAGGHGVRGPRHPRLGRAVHLLPGQAADGEGPRPVVAVPARGGQEAPGRGRAPATASRRRCSTTSTSRR